MLEKDSATAEREAIPDISGRDIVIIGLQPWYFKTGCNAKNIAQLLAKNNRVIYVNVPIKRRAYHAATPDPNILPHIEIIRKGEDKLRSLGPNLWEFYPPSLIESVNGLPFTWAFKMLNRINNQRTARDIRWAMDELDFKNIILFNDNDIYNGFYLKELLNPDLYVYYLRDFLQAFSYWRKHASVLEPQLIRKSDIVMANSIVFAEYAGKINPHTYYMGQGCDFEHFDPSKVPAIPQDLAALPRPIIGYVGAVNSERLDPAIVAAMAKAQPSWSIVMVGPEDEGWKNSPLHKVANVHFLGGKPFHQLSAYVKGFDVCINPQFRNEITRGNYPLKIDEYLAMGKPSVATRTEAMKLFEGHVYLADSSNDYEGLVKKALAENDAAKEAERIRFAGTHSWENCIAALAHAIHIVKK